MNRRLFMGTLAGGIMAGTLLRSTGSRDEKMPTLFFGHGSPMNAVEKNSFTDFLIQASTQIPRPRAILAISAHWETRGTKVLSLERPKTIHDFSGFPEILYKIQYPAKGDLKLADTIVDLMKAHNVVTDSEWGLDHGTWSVLKHLYPDADIPVLQMSLNKNKTFAEHLAIARDLKKLRDQGVLILGSGNITHNLRLIDWSGSYRSTDWAVEFDELIKKGLLDRNEKMLLGPDEKSRALWSTAHPTLEHYLPLLYAYGASDEEDEVKFIFEGFQMGSLSMRSVRFG
jgi:4,5-DOPA dioxygenase extradiol